jgi:hypothetical protein
MTILSERLCLGSQSPEAHASYRESGRNQMSDEELREHNASVMEQMDSAAAAVIQATLRSLDRSSTRIKLRNPDGHSVGYDLVAGEINYVKAYAKANGVQSVTGDKMTVAG